MKTQLTERLSGKVITDVKNYSTHNEYNDVNDVLAGGSGKGDNDNLTLENVIIGDQDPDLAKQLEAKLLADEAKAKLEEETRLAELERNKGTLETPEQKLIREAKELEEKANEITLDTEGNQVDAEGKILKTKEILEQEALALEEANNVPLINEIIKTSGVEILDEAGKPKVYEDTVEGIIKYNNDLAEHKLRISQEQLFKDFPDVKKYLEAKIKGISDEDYFGSSLINWKSIKLDDKNLDQQFEIIVNNLENSGISKERAFKMATLIKDSGKDNLLEESKIALGDLQTKQLNIEKANKEQYEAESKVENEKIVAHWNKVSEVINSGKLGEYMIPEVDRKAFNDYVSKSVDENGNSAAMIARNKLTLEQKLINDYYTFKGMDFSVLAKNTINKQVVNNLRDRINKEKGGVNVKLDDKGNIKISDLTLENIVKS